MRQSYTIKKEIVEQNIFCDICGKPYKQYMGQNEYSTGISEVAYDEVTTEAIIIDLCFECTKKLKEKIYRKELNLK